MGAGFPPEPVLGPAKGRTRVRSPLPTPPKQPLRVRRRDRRAKQGRIISRANKIEGNMVPIVVATVAVFALGINQAPAAQVSYYEVTRGAHPHDVAPAPDG